ncbi:predicted protein [Lichtheimia corymbifera JMRC:FSU:9682]|uniref:TRP C-terminal domain-containing protein n=1 Tax=Lichtheimia corymbifera JMRC:FSU:9682 TaxID=1263082 RepID=A0A068S3U8_9FUNG|nr:predicted protein [Lichtheimia corymbifera JMRC:FSU:9682]
MQISFPLLDIGARYELTMEGSTPVVCVEVAPVGYINREWQKVFLYMPLSLIALAAFVTLLAILSFNDGSRYYDFFVAVVVIQSSGITMDDAIAYAQFVFAAGTLNLAYPQFYALFTANFSWSWLLFSPSWLHHILDPDAKDVGVAASTNLTHLANVMEIDLRALFLTSILFFGVCLVVLILICLTIWICYEILAISNSYRFSGNRRKLGSVCIGWIIQLTTIAYLPLTALSFYQLMVPGPWYLTVLSSFMLAGVLFGVYSRIVILVTQRHGTSSDPSFLLRYGQLYTPLRRNTFYFFIIVLLHRLLLGGMIGLFQMSGEAQAGVLLIMDIAMLALYATLSPYVDRVANFLAVLTAAVRSIVDALNVLFLASIALTDRQKQYVAYTQVVLHFVVFAVYLGIHLSRLLMILLGGCYGYGSCWRRPNYRRRNQNQHLSFGQHQQQQQHTQPTIASQHEEQPFASSLIVSQSPRRSTLLQYPNTSHSTTTTSFPSSFTSFTEDP